MTENQWTKSICSMLEGELGGNIQVDVLQKIPYAFEIGSFADDWTIDGACTETSFETDLVIFERNNGRIVPRVIIEAKVGTVTSHDAITYSHKAACHKNVIPFVRYGIMIGNREKYPLPGRLFRHGSDFDFLFSFIGYEATEKEKRVFINMLRKEIDYSRRLEEILSNSRNKNRKRYFMLQKEFRLMELED